VGEEHVVDNQADAAFGAIVAGIATQAANIETRHARVLLQRAEMGTRRANSLTRSIRLLVSSAPETAEIARGTAWSFSRDGVRSR
jgi:hypothetical protein